MSSAPPVRIRVVPDRLVRGFVLVCASLAAANLMAWILSWADGTTGLSAIAVPLATGAAAALAWRMLTRRGDATGALIWDGSTWQWAPGLDAPRSGHVQVMIDLGPWALLRFCPSVPGGRSVWLAISRHAAAGQWPAWRTALYAPGADASAPAASGPA